MKKTLWLLICFAACGPSGVPNSPLDGPPGCDEKAYAALVSGATADMVLACSEFDSLDDCPSNTKEPVTKKWKKKFDDWAICSTDSSE